MAKTTTTTAPRLKALYATQFAKELQTELDLVNINQVPKLEKIVISVGTGKSKDDKRMLAAVKNTLTRVTGQLPVEKLANVPVKGIFPPIVKPAAIPIMLASAIPIWKKRSG